MRAGFCSLALVLVVAAALTSFSPSVAAQQTFGPHGPSIHGVPPSVTSFGFGGQ